VDLMMGKVVGMRVVESDCVWGNL
jgi:hypothetical protein